MIKKTLSKPTQEPNKVGRPSKYSPNALTVAKVYLQESIDDDFIPYIEKVAMRLGVHRETILNWGKEEDVDGNKLHQEFFDTIKRIEDIQRFKLQELGLMNKINPTIAIFMMKANHNMIETERKEISGPEGKDISFKVVRGEE